MEELKESLLILISTPIYAVVIGGNFDFVPTQARHLHRKFRLTTFNFLLIRIS
jgi:hypothetical protein